MKSISCTTIYDNSHYKKVFINHEEIKPSNNFRIDPDTHMATCLDCGNVANVLPHYCPINDGSLRLSFHPQFSVEVNPIN